MKPSSDEIDEINRQLANLRGSSRAADGTVIIETDPTGRITYLYIADYAMDRGPDQLSRTIADRHRAAMNDVETKVVALFESLPKPSNSAYTAPAAPPRAPLDEEAGFSYVPSHLRR